jgi:hypothetical protein
MPEPTAKDVTHVDTTDYLYTLVNYDKVHFSCPVRIHHVSFLLNGNRSRLTPERTTRSAFYIPGVLGQPVTGLSVSCQAENS